MNKVLKDLKWYLDFRFGEDNGDIVVQSIRCKINNNNQLELMLFTGSSDAMVTIATIDDDFNIFYNYGKFESYFYQYCPELNNESIDYDIVFKELIDFIISDYEDYISTIGEIVHELKIIKKEDCR